MTKSVRVTLFGILVLGFALTAARAALVIDSAAVSPASTPVGVATAVAVTAVITEPTVLPQGVNLQRLDSAGRVIAVLGLLTDDGTNGDAIANDKTFTLRTNIFETAPGPVRLRVSAAFQGSITRGFSSVLTVNVTGTTATGITILSPANLAYLNTSPVNVAGAIGDPGAVVTINGIKATTSNRNFITTVPLVEGNNTLTGVAQNTGGTTSTASIQVTLDTTPPHVTIESPQSNLTTTDVAITVAGTVNDIVVGTVNNQQAQVTVNGVAAQVANRSFVASGIPLALGLNTIQAIARDRSGNQATTSVQVTRQTPSKPFIRVLSGNNQSGAISSQLPSALVVALDNGHGQPVANAPVVFRVTDNNGLLNAGGPAGLSLVAATNSSGRAQAFLKLGSRSGAGSNRVEATATGFDGVAAFTETGLPAGASLITVDAGNNQSGALGEKLAFPFVVVVTDAGFNRIGGVPVTFNVKQGGGNINGLPNFTMNTDPDGRAVAVLTLGTQPGLDNNLVEASFPGNPVLPASFVASAKTPGNISDTKITGVVLDNSNNPIAGVTMRLFLTNQGNVNNTPVSVGSPVQTNAQGTFLIQPAPVGYFKLMADGTTVPASRGSFPTLEYDLVTVAGQNNTLGMPIFLPLLDIVNRLCVNETTGGTLTLPKVPGFSLTVAAGSATFPGGARSGCVSVSTVNPDKSPMPPGFGQQPRFLITVQPVGTLFNPPAPITMPNVDGLIPGQVTELYSYDHDLAAFTAIGTGTVSSDGLLIKSDPGVGILKAGWHCGGNPAVPGSGQPVSVHILTPVPIATVKTGIVPISALGLPLENPHGTYLWTSSDPAIVSLSNSTSPTVIAKGVGKGKATLIVRFTCSSVDENGEHPYKETPVEVTVVQLTTENVSFEDDIPILKDVVGSITLISDPVWKRTNAPAQNEPVGYVRNTKMKAIVTFSVDPVPPVAVNGLIIEGLVSGLGKFKKTGVTVPPGAVFSVPGIETDANLPNTTKYYNPLKIDWKYTADGTNYDDIDDSENKVYVTLAEPLFNTYLTTLHLAVSKDGATDDASAFANSWSFFGDGAQPKNVTGWDGRPLSYYPMPTPFLGCATNVTDLLTSPTGGARCGAFARFLTNVAGVNGITVFNVIAQAKEDYGFLVKNWSTVSMAFPAAPQYKYRYTAPAPTPFNEMTPYPPGNVYGDMRSDSGAAGQNSPTPSEKFFADHQFIQTLFDLKYYDPSYGLVYTDADDFENQAIAGYVFKNVPGDPPNVGRVRNSLGLKKMKFTIIP